MSPTRGVCYTLVNIAPAYGSCDDSKSNDASACLVAKR